MGIRSSARRWFSQVTFGQQKEFHVAALPHDLPCLLTPPVGFLQEEIRGHTDPDQLAASDFIISFPILLKRISKTCLCLVDIGSVSIPYPIQKEHITVLAALAALHAAVPGIPDIMHELCAILGSFLF
jgi:hypothetical protein